jgi:hypothetical protein
MIKTAEHPYIMYTVSISYSNTAWIELRRKQLPVSQPQATLLISQVTTKLILALDNVSK